MGSRRKARRARTLATARSWRQAEKEASEAPQRAQPCQGSGWFPTSGLQNWERIEDALLSF